MRYRTRPVSIEAMLFDGTNHYEIGCWMDPTDKTHNCRRACREYISINTWDATDRAYPHDYVVRSPHGEFRPMRPDLFEELYESLEE